MLFFEKYSTLTLNVLSKLTIEDSFGSRDRQTSFEEKLTETSVSFLRGGNKIFGGSSLIATTIKEIKVKDITNIRFLHIR